MILSREFMGNKFFHLTLLMNLFTITFDNSDSDIQEEPELKPHLPTSKGNGFVRSPKIKKLKSTIAVRKIDLSLEPQRIPTKTEIKRFKPKPPPIEEEEEEDEEEYDDIKTKIREEVDVQKDVYKEAKNETKTDLYSNKLHPDEQDDLNKSKKPDIEQINEKVLIHQPSFKSMVVYTVQRIPKREWKGRNNVFVVYQNNQAVLNGKFQYPYLMNIYRGEPYKVGDQLGSILLNQTLDCFALRNDNQYGDEVASIKFFYPIHEPRLLKLYLHYVTKESKYPNVLESKKFRKKNEKKETDYDNKNLFNDDPSVIPSVKNCILRNRKNHEFAKIKKVEKHLLHIEVEGDIPSMCVMLLGVTSFLARSY